jgi:hypothetical protein
MEHVGTWRKLKMGIKFWFESLLSRYHLGYLCLVWEYDNTINVREIRRENQNMILVAGLFEHRHEPSDSI